MTDIKDVVSAGAYLDEQPVPSNEPVVPALERGKVYESLGPRQEKIMLMTEETWTDFGTNMASLRQALSHMTRKLKEAETDKEVAMRRLTDVTTRLENLRAIRREEKRPEVEAMFDFNTPTKG